MEGVRTQLAGIGTYPVPLAYLRTLGEIELRAQRDTEAAAVFAKAVRLAEWGLLGLASAVIIGAEEVKGKYSQGDFEEARKHFGGVEARRTLKVEEFPSKK